MQVLVISIILHCLLQYLGSFLIWPCVKVTLVMNYVLFKLHFVSTHFYQSIIASYRKMDQKIILTVKQTSKKWLGWLVKEVVQLLHHVFKGYKQIFKMNPSSYQLKLFMSKLPKHFDSLKLILWRKTRTGSVAHFSSCLNLIWGQGHIVNLTK